jgi:hypothetical protein
MADTYMVDNNVAANRSEALKRFATTEDLRHQIQGWQHATCKKLKLSGSATDHNHDGYVHDTLTFELVLHGNVSNANVGHVLGTLPPLNVQANTIPGVVPQNTGFTIPQ